ncbi:hypothetical protein Athai_44070 [Actinocatenispora thailandica]|uniref:Uncharacterized protein n=1 Tax=Actinocatenispora thailandica TaxID=227318 RepID=A0A7R7HZ28_9ACTN|nr:hypothetical protein Athai_44070 [Actinocatenispora thailandica]
MPGMPSVKVPGVGAGTPRPAPAQPGPGRVGRGQQREPHPHGAVRARATGPDEATGPSATEPRTVDAVAPRIGSPRSVRRAAAVGRGR